MPLILFKKADSPNYYLRGTVMGIPYYRSTGTDVLKYAEAIRIKTEGRLLDEAVFGARAVVTFCEVAESYGTKMRYVAPLVGHFGEKNLNSICQADLDAAAEKLYPGTLPETRNRQCYTPFIAIWNHAATNGWAEVRRWRRPRKAKGTNVGRVAARNGDRPTNYDKAAVFVSNMSPAAAITMTILFYTGMRPIEALALEEADINVQKRWIVVRSSKTGEPRGVPMHEFLAPIFESLLSRNDGVPQVIRDHRGLPYPLQRTRASDGEQYPVGGQFKTAIKGARARLVKAATPIDDISPYTARHTVSTQLVVNGIHPHIKDQILGHAVDSMSRRYTTVPQALLIDAINTLPVSEVWRQMWWLDEPLARSSELVKWGKRGPRQRPDH